MANLPLIKPGDDLAGLVLAALEGQGESFRPGDVLCLAQKVVSKSEGRLVNLAGIKPSERAIQIAPVAGKDPRHVEVILGESRRVIWVSSGIFVVETHQGFVCANAGVDRSNIDQPGQDEGQEWVCLLPLDPDASATRIRAAVLDHSGVDVAVLINDTHGRPFRMGGQGLALGLSGFPALSDHRGHADLFGYQLQATLTATGDELAAAASLIMGQAAEGTPAVLVRGLGFHHTEPGCDKGAADLIRPAEKDVFRYPPGSEQWR